MALTDNLVSYYDLEDRFDAHGANDLTEVGTPTYASALDSNGLVCDAVADQLYLASNMSLSWSGDYTWQFWTYKPSGAAFSGYMADHVTTTGNNRRVLFIWDTTGSNNLTIYCGGFNAGETFVAGSLSTLTWYHWVLVKTGTSWELFKNGTSVGTKTSGTTTYSVNKFAIGGSVDPNGGGTCNFDMAGLWNRALTSSEVTQLYNSGAGLNYAALSGGGGVVKPQFTGFSHL
jgi:Concanavalin A-like lectin/glucanases superfamily